MATATFGTNHAAAQTQWLKELFKGHLRNNMFAPFMDVNGGNAIIIKNVENKAGDTFKVHFRDNASGDEGVSGDTALTATAIGMTTDSVTIDRYRHAVSVENFAMSDQRVIIDLEQQIAGPQLQEWMEGKVQKLILNQLLSTSTGRTQNRYQYGAVGTNYNATEATAKANIDNSADKLTLDLLSLVKRKAQTQDSRTAGRIRPTQLKLESGRVAKEKFVFLGHTLAIRDLKASSDFKARISNREAQQFDVINGATFVGEHEGILIYEMFNSEMLEASSIQIAHNLFLGADAAIMAYGNVAKPAGALNAFTDPKNKALATREITDHAGDVAYGLTFVAGPKKLVNSVSGTAEDNAVVHVYTAAVADA